MQGELQRRLMTQHAQKAWDAWGQYTITLRVVRSLSMQLSNLFVLDLE